MIIPEPSKAPSTSRVIISGQYSLNAIISIMAIINRNATAEITIIFGICFSLDETNMADDIKASSAMSLKAFVGIDEWIMAKNDEITAIISNVITIWLGIWKLQNFFRQTIVRRVIEIPPNTDQNNKISSHPNNNLFYCIVTYLLQNINTAIKKTIQ